jgi:hypothetical protein
MFPPSRRSAAPSGAVPRAEPNLPTTAPRAAPRLVPVDPPPGARGAAALPRFELVADERPSLASVDPVPRAQAGKSMAVKAALAVVAVLALVGAGSLVERFLGL